MKNIIKLCIKQISRNMEGLKSIKCLSYLKNIVETGDVGEGVTMTTSECGLWALLCVVACFVSSGESLKFTQQLRTRPTSPTSCAWRLSMCWASVNIQFSIKVFWSDIGKRKRFPGLSKSWNFCLPNNFAWFFNFIFCFMTENSFYVGHRMIFLLTIYLGKFES